MRHLYILIITLFFSTFGASQPFDLENFENLSFRNLGPAGMSGRVTTIDVDPMNKNIIYIGSASGGVWKSENGGITWNPIFDDQTTLSIGAIKINPQNGDEIWVGTGEGNPRNSLNTGGGIYKSIDGGKSWKMMGLKETKVIHRIIVNRQNPEIVHVAAMGSPWGDNDARGVYKTINGGETWSKILYNDQKTGAADLVVDPDNPNKLLAAMWHHRREPWFFTSGGKSSGLYLSYDGGENWKQLTSKEGLPEGELGRIGLAMAPSDPDIIYALIEAKVNGLYKSVDGGENWKLVSTKNIGNRPFYYSELYVDPSNENRIYNLWSYVSLSEDGGKTFKTIMDYGNNVHPDHHAFWIDPSDPDYLINGNDGGLNISRDRGENWRFIPNLPIGQFYHVNVDDDIPYHVYGGMQDNGSWIGPGFSLKRGGIINHDFQELYFGDGFDVVPYRKDSRYGYAMSQGGNVAYYDRYTGATQRIKPVSSDSISLRYNWNAPIAQDPFSDCGVYFGSQRLHYSKDCGSSWTDLSGDLTTNDTTKQKQNISGGLTIDATNAENFTTLISIAPSPLAKGLVYVGSDDGLLHKTTDQGANWKDLSRLLPGLPSGSWLPQIHTSTHDKEEVFVVANNYRRNDYGAYAYRSSNGGNSFERIADNTQIKGFVLSIIQDPVNADLLFMGTDVGLYVSFNRGKKWIHWTEGMPAVQITDLKIQNNFSDLVIGTFGRSLWVLDDLEVLRELNVKNGMPEEDDFAVFTPEDAYLWSYRSYRGERFVAQGTFKGANKARGARIPVWIKAKKEMTADPAKESKKVNNGEKKKNEIDMIVKVLNESGDTIRKYETKIKGQGLQFVRYNLRKDGTAFPARKLKEKKEEYLPSGDNVEPGKYKLILCYGDYTDSCFLDVKQDPRFSSSQGAISLANNLKMEKVEIAKATAAMEDLLNIKKHVNLIKKYETLLDDSLSKKLKLLNKDMIGKIKKLEGLYFMPEDTKGIQRNPNTVMAKINNSRSYLGGRLALPGENAELAIDKANVKITEAVDEISSFKNEDYKEYLETLESYPLDLTRSIFQKSE